MHGYLTVADFGFPAIIVAKGKSKFNGLVRKSSTPETLVTSWADVSDFLASFDKPGLPHRFQCARAAEASELDIHW